MKRLSHREEAVMHILWELKEAFVHDILEQMDTPKPPYNTVSSIVRKLVKEQFVGYKAYGRTHRYFPLIEKEAYCHSSFQRFVDRYFGGSPQALLSYFLEEQQLPPEEVEDLLHKIKQRHGGD